MSNREIKISLWSDGNLINLCSICPSNFSPDPFRAFFLSRAWKLSLTLPALWEISCCSDRLSYRRFSDLPFRVLNQPSRSDPFPAVFCFPAEIRSYYIEGYIEGWKDGLTKDNLRTFRSIKSGLSQAGFLLRLQNSPVPSWSSDNPELSSRFAGSSLFPTPDPPWTRQSSFLISRNELCLFFYLQQAIHSSLCAPAGVKKQRCFDYPDSLLHSVFFSTLFNPINRLYKCLLMLN